MVARITAEGIGLLIGNHCALAAGYLSNGIGVSLRDMSKLAGNLRALRERNKLSHQDVADWFGISKVSVWGWEHKGKIPTPKKLIELAERYGTSVELLMNGEFPLDDTYHDTPPIHGDISGTTGHTGRTSTQIVRVRSVIQLMASGAVQEASQTDVVRVIRTDKLKKTGSFYALMVASSANPAFRNGSAILVSEAPGYKMDRLCVVTLQDGQLLLLAPLVEHDNAIKFECMDGTTRTIVRPEIAKIEAVAAIDADPDEGPA